MSENSYSTTVEELAQQVHRPLLAFSERVKTLTWLIGLMVVTALFSWIALMHQSLRLDEAQSLWQVSHSPQMIFNLVAQDVHVPLYHLILHYWEIGFGQSVTSARALSLMFFVGLIPAVYLLGKEAFGRFSGLSVSLFASLLVAISPFMNWYGSEIRMYSLLGLVTVLNQYFFLRIFHGRNNSWSWFGFGVTALAGAFTHYFFIFFMIAQVIFAVLRRRDFAPDSFKKFAGIAILVIAALSVWGVYAFKVGLAVNTKPLLVKPSSVDLFNSFSEFFFGFQSDYLNALILSLWPILVLGSFLLLRKNRKFTPEALYFLVIGLVPILITFAISELYRPIYLTRYLILAAPSLFLLASWAITNLPRRIVSFAKIGLVILIISSLGVQTASSQTPVKEDYRSVATYLNTQAQPQDVIAVSAPFTIYPLEYYYRGAAAINTLPIWNRFITGPIPGFDPAQLPAQVSQIKGDHRNLWLVLSYDQGYEDQIRLYMDAHYQRLQEIQFSPKLSLFEYKLRYD